MALLSISGSTIPTPSKYEWSLQDVSVGDSGRDDTGKMYKGRIAQKVKIALEWAGKSPTVVSTVLAAFNPEYVEVTYFDPLTNSNQLKTFYVGDRSAPVKIWTTGNQIFETVAFDIIER